jgi:hypothetical protein
MATWTEIFVKQATLSPPISSSATIAFAGGQSAAPGNKVILVVTAASDASLVTSDLTNNGWSLDLSVKGSQRSYIFSYSVTETGLSQVTVSFSAASRPILYMVELTGVSVLNATASLADQYSTGTVTTTVNDTVLIGAVQGVINGGEPEFNTWSNSFTGLGSVLSQPGAPYDFPNRVSMGISRRVVTASGAYSSTATMSGDGGPAIIAPIGMVAAYQIGAVAPTVGAGADTAIPLNGTFSRTATEDNGGGLVTARSWVIQAGPANVGQTISTSATLSWTPSVAGNYTLRYNATNSAGTSHDDVAVGVIAPVITTKTSSPMDVTLTTGLWRSRIRAEGPGVTSAYSAWSSPFAVTMGELDFSLSRVPWEGGPSYWSQFSRANASGWTNPTHFPISVFFGKADPAHVASLKDAGINLYMGVEHSPEIYPLTNVTSQGLYAMPNINEWTPAEVGNNDMAVSWFISDEFDMGMGVRQQPGDQNTWLAEQQEWVALADSFNDGRFHHANFGNGILRTYWSQANGAMEAHVALMDSSSADKYTYTSPDVAGIIDGAHDAPDWPNGAPVPRAYSYGWQADQMKRFQNPANPKPIWTFIETAKPFLTESGSRSILPEEIEGAVWSALIHEARGIAYFQHNNDGRDSYSIVGIPEVHTKVKAINAKVKSLAAVLNTQSYYNTTVDVNGFTYYRYTFNNGTDTMLKTHGGFAYIFAGIGIGHSLGTKSFTVPVGVAGTTVEVVGESRSLTVTGGSFSDTFANEYTHHVYKIAL